MPEKDTTKEPAGYELEEQIGFLLRLVQQRHTTLFAECFGGDLTPTQWALISKLKQVGECSQNLLGRMTAMDVATIQGVVDRLKKRNLVESRPDPDDKRRVVLSLSAEGEAVYAQHLPNAVRVTEETLAPLGAEERLQLHKFMRKLS